MDFTLLLLIKIGAALFALVAPLLSLLGLPGMWLALVGLGAAEYWSEPRLYSSTTIVGCLCLAVLGELWEFSASSVRAKRAGAGRRGSLGALLGGIAGAILGSFAMPIVGTLVGGGVGALLLSTLLEKQGGRSMGEAVRIGRAAAAGQMIGVAGKLMAAIALAVWIVIATFW